MIKRNILYIISGIIVIAAGAGAIWYYTAHHKTSKPQTPAAVQQNQSNTTNQQTPAQQTNKTYPVLVYFSKHPDSDNDPSKTFPVQRISPDLGVASYAVTQLLTGPGASESSQGYFSTAKLRGGTGSGDFKISISNSVATLQFLKPFDHLGVVADGQADSEIKATLKQFSSVKKVVILNSQGNCEFDLSGQNLCLQQ